MKNKQPDDENYDTPLEGFTGDQTQDDTNMGLDDDIPLPPPKKISDKELIERVKKRKGMTTFYRVVRTLDAIKHNLDIVILLIYSLIAIGTGALIALCVIIGGTWLYAGGTLAGLATLIGFFVSVISPRGRFSSRLDSPEFIENLKKLEDGVTNFFHR